MAYEQRRPRDGFFGTLSQPATISDTTLTGAAFANLPSDYSTGVYMPLTLKDDLLGVMEIVWVTGHAAGSQTVTVVRARESTAALAWSAATRFECAPTIRDAVMRGTVQPTDPHYGLRFYNASAGVTRLEVYSFGGWRPLLGVAPPETVGFGIDGVTQPPTTSVITMRSGLISGTTDANGDVTGVFRVAFPGGCNSVTITSTRFALNGPYVVSATSATGFSARAFSGTAAQPNTAYSAFYQAVGW